MIGDVITYLNNRIAVLGYFSKVLCLVEKIEREGRVYPAQYNTNNEYLEINLDEFGSICYWRKNGDINFSQAANQTGIGVEYTGTVPLKFVGFIKKEEATNDQYFSDNICASIISNLTVNNSALKPMLKAKKATIYATKTITDARTVANDEYDNVPFEARYNYAFFAIDFELQIVTNQQCYVDPCDQPAFTWGFVTVTDGATETQVQCGTSYTCEGGVGTPATVHNSDSSYSTTVACGGDLPLPDETVNVYIDGVLNQSVTYIPLSTTEINISI